VTSTFKRGMVVAYGEMRQGTMHRVICLFVVKLAGKQHVRLEESRTLFDLGGYEKSYQQYGSRGILPLTRTLYEQAVADKAACLRLAPDEILFPTK
jgi:hypothetical protein